MRLPDPAVELTKTSLAAWIAFWMAGQGRVAARVSVLCVHEAC